MVQLAIVINEWLDWFRGKKNYTDDDAIKHLSERHHWEGIQKACSFQNSYRYGGWSRQIYYLLALNHVRDDFSHIHPALDIPRKIDYHSQNFWKIVRQEIEIPKKIHDLGWAYKD